jgi:hypothetical protein
MSLTTIMMVKIDDPKSAVIEPPINCSLGSHVWSLPKEKPRLAAKVFSIFSALLSQFNLIREGGFLHNYLGKNFEAIDKSLAPIDLVSNGLKLGEKIQAKAPICTLISDISKTFTNFRDTLKGVSFFTGSENAPLMTKVEVIKSGLDIVSSGADLKKAWNAIPKGEIRKYGQEVAKTPKGLQQAIKIIKNLATFTLGSLGLLHAVKGKKPEGNLQLGLATVAVASSVADHYIGRKIEDVEACRVHKDFNLVYSKAC